MNLIKRSITATEILFCWFVYPLSYIPPKNKNVWIFIGWHKGPHGETFADNCKYMFLHVANERPDIKAIWIAKDKHMADLLSKHGYLSYPENSFFGIYFSLIAGYTFIGARLPRTNWKLSGRSKVIQLWHGDGIKKINLGIKTFLENPLQTLGQPGLHKKIYRYISTSTFFAEKFIGPSFNVSSTHILPSGLPRYDALFDHNIPGLEIDFHTELKDFIAQARTHNPNKLILYAPTFRGRKGADSLLKPIHLDDFQRALEKENNFLFVSLHPKFASSDWIPKKIYPNIFFINTDNDKYPLISEFDLLITDYSSICIEFLLLDKPTIFYVYDYEEYLQERGIKKEVWDTFPGKRVLTFNDLISTITDPDDPNTRTAARKLLFDYDDTKSCHRIAEYLKPVNKDE